MRRRKRNTEITEVHGGTRSGDGLGMREGGILEREGFGGGEVGWMKKAGRETDGEEG